jgi:hypothetical protein
MERTELEKVTMTGKVYTIRVQGLLDETWSEWFEGWTIRQETDGTSLLVGIVPDQSALHGVLNKIRDLNLTLISVTKS